MNQNEKSFKKLSLNKITIANIDASVMNQKVGGAKTKSVTIYFPTIADSSCHQILCKHL